MPVCNIFCWNFVLPNYLIIPFTSLSFILYSDYIYNIVLSAHLFISKRLQSKQHCLSSILMYSQEIRLYMFHNNWNNSVAYYLKLKWLHALENKWRTFSRIKSFIMACSLWICMICSGKKTHCSCWVVLHDALKRSLFCCLSLS